MNPNNKTEMAHPQPPAPDTVDRRPPMVSKKQGLSRRIQVGLARLGLIATVATGGAAGVAHHVNPDIGGPVGAVGTIPDVVGSAAVDLGIKGAEFAAKTGADLAVTVGSGIVKLANAEPQQAQEDLNQALKDAQKSFVPDSASVDGQVQINFADLSHAITIADLAEIRLGDPHNEFDLGSITAVDNNPAKPGSIIEIDSPEEVNIPGVGLGMFYTFSINTPEGQQPVIIPEAFAHVIKPGKLEKLSSIQDDNVLNSLNRVRVINPTP